MGDKPYLELKDLNVYKSSCGLCIIAWKIYNNLDWNTKKIIGIQFIRAVDSIGANIAEGYGRYHYLDKIRFYYNSRGSLFEARHWINIIIERKLIYDSKLIQEFNKLLDEINLLLNGLIKSTLNQKNKE